MSAPANDDRLKLLSRIEITVWKDETGEDAYCYDTIIKDKNGTELFVDLPPEHSKAYDWVSPGIMVGLLSNQENGQLVCYPTVKTFVLKGITGMWLVMPNDFEIIQRRKHVRVDVHTPITLKPLTEGGLNLPFRGTLVNVSAGGARVLLKSKKIEVDTLYELAFCLKEDGPLYTLKARSIYQRAYVSPGGTKSSESKDLSLVAFQYEDMPKELEKRLIQGCFQLELKRAH